MLLLKRQPAKTLPVWLWVTLNPQPNSERWQRDELSPRAASRGLQVPAVPKAVLLCGRMDALSRKHPERLDGKLARLSECIVEKGLRLNACHAVPTPGLLLTLAGGSFLSFLRGELSLWWLCTSRFLFHLPTRMHVP